ncbi:MAG: hypothetical protein ACU0BB_02065 [Paracoccaceae bacterium]
MTIKVRRALNDPIIHTGLDPAIGHNINGPALIKAPEWLPDRRGRFYLYFAHHLGDHIRLAIADDVRGPWAIHAPGALRLDQTPLPQSAPSTEQPEWARLAETDGLYAHVASPDVHVDAAARCVRMVFHGLDHDGEQRSLEARSWDGVTWDVAPRRIDQTYLRCFAYQSTRYALAWGGQLLRDDGLGGFTMGPWIFPKGHRHCAVLVRGDLLHVFWTRIGDRPEHILHSRVTLGSGDWQSWRVEQTQSVLKPELPWEGADLPLACSKVGAALAPEHALRDPFLFEDGGRVYLIYVGGGETALGLAEVTGL